MPSEINENKLVVAWASPAQPGAVGVVQLAGPNASAVLGPRFSKPLPDAPGVIRLGEFRDLQNQTVDQVLVVCIPGRPELFEITCHGGIRILQRIIDVLERSGATLVSPETLLPRTFGLDSPAAEEAYRLLPQAKTQRAVIFLLHQAHDGLSRWLRQSPRPDPAQVLRYWPAVRALIDGARVAIAGPPNAGKSTLLNSLSRMEYALVADHPGTTRDHVQARAELAGLPVELIDTAGLGQTADPLAEKVRERAEREIRTADLVLVLLDTTDPGACVRFLREFQPSQPSIILLNKIDSPGRTLRHEGLTLSPNTPILEISALKKTNLDKLPTLVATALGLDGFDDRQPTIFTQPLADLVSRPR